MIAGSFESEKFVSDACRRNAAVISLDRGAKWNIAAGRHKEKADAARNIP